MSRIKDISTVCISNWGEDEKTQHFGNKLGKYVSQLGDNKEVGEILLKLTERFEYYSRARMEHLFKEFNSIVNNKLMLNTDKTIYSIIEDKEKLSSSSTFLEEYRIVNGIDSYYGARLCHLTKEDCNYIDNIVFIDDIIGSGKTVIDFLTENIVLLKKVRIIIICIVIMNEAKKNMLEFIEVNKLNCTILSSAECDKAFKPGNVFNVDEYKQKEQELRKFEIDLWKRKSDYILGLNDSQALVAFFRNTPNNTISSFWFENENWKALFPRNNDKPLYIRQRRKARYNLKKQRTNK